MYLVTFFTVPVRAWRTTPSIFLLKYETASRPPSGRYFSRPISHWSAKVGFRFGLPSVKRNEFQLAVRL
ncbi:hypothetical protein D3C87_2143720 [compost metagenome]